MTNTLRRVVARNRAGEPLAIPSVCSSHPAVLNATLLQARELGVPIVIEATSNQVNQDGGYTGMTPVDFIRFVGDLAGKARLDHNQIIFGGDHLGPQAWRKQPAEEAMEKAHQMVADYVKAGFTKIHLDCSEGCAGEPAQLDDQLAAGRAAELARTCLNASDDPNGILFVVGTEVPPPGGARTDENEDIQPTTAHAVNETLKAHKVAFEAAGVGHAWPQVVGLVVQPGVEFTPMHVHQLPLDRDPGLLGALQDWPGICLEAHSTDYQSDQTYKRLAELGFAFQKVGPALTFAYREAIYALDLLGVLAGWKTSLRVKPALDKAMLDNPAHWQSHYNGTEEQMEIMRHFALADRSRYYWVDEQVQAEVSGLLTDLDARHLPRPLLHQVFGDAALQRAGNLVPYFSGSLPQALIAAKIQLMMAPYFWDAE